MTVADTGSLNDALELDPSPRPSMRGCLLGARPMIGGLGAGGLKILACSWFALGLGTLSLLPNAAGADKTVRIAAGQGPQADPSVQTTARAPQQVSPSKLVPASERHTSRATRAEDAPGVVTPDVAGGPLSTGTTADGPAAGQASDASNPSATPGPPAPPAPVEPTVAEASPEPLPAADVLEVLPLPVPPVPPLPPIPPLPAELPLPGVADVTSGLGLP
jgi:hypothetical protein